MISTGRHGEKSGYLVILLVVVGLTAFSHSMKDLTEIHHLTWDASRLIAQWSGNVAPVAIPQSQTLVKIETRESCERKQSAPLVELPWLNETPKAIERNVVAPARRQQIRMERLQPPVITLPSEAEIARLKRLSRFEINSEDFEFRVSADTQNADSDDTIPDALHLSSFKAKARRHGVIRISPRDREMILKTLNRSINLRIAS
jgi:hypothetical protein